MQGVGADARGVELEIVADPDDRNPGGLAVIHAMPHQLPSSEVDQE